MIKGARYEAIQKGNYHYLSSRPCKRGHLALRVTNSGTCVKCRKILEKVRYDANPQKAIEHTQKHYAKNAEIIKAKRRAKYVANPNVEREESKLRSREWRKNNPGYHTFLTRTYKADKIKATPTWINKERVKALYQLAAMLNKNTDQKWHVDHVIPLRHPLVCGLHTYENLRVITAEENMKKSNNFEVA